MMFHTQHQVSYLIYFNARLMDVTGANMWKIKIGVTTMKETGIVQIAWRNVSMTKIAEVLNARKTALIKPMDIFWNHRSCINRNSNSSYSLSLVIKDAGSVHWSNFIPWPMFLFPSKRIQCLVVGCYLVSWWKSQVFARTICEKSSSGETGPNFLYPRHDSLN